MDTFTDREEGGVRIVPQWGWEFVWLSRVGVLYLSMFNAGRESGDVSLCFGLECLHFCDELWPGCYVDIIVGLEVQEAGAGWGV